MNGNVIRHAKAALLVSQLRRQRQGGIVLVVLQEDIVVQPRRQPPIGRPRHLVACAEQTGVDIVVDCNTSPTAEFMKDAIRDVGGRDIRGVVVPIEIGVVDDVEAERALPSASNKLWIEDLGVAEIARAVVRRVGISRAVVHRDLHRLPGNQIRRKQMHRVLFRTLDRQFPADDHIAALRAGVVGIVADASPLNGRPGLDRELGSCFNQYGPADNPVIFRREREVLADHARNVLASLHNIVEAADSRVFGVVFIPAVGECRG